FPSLSLPWPLRREARFNRKVEVLQPAVLGGPGNQLRDVAETRLLAQPVDVRVDGVGRTAERPGGGRHRAVLSHGADSTAILESADVTLCHECFHGLFRPAVRRTGASSRSLALRPYPKKSTGQAV